MTYKIIGDSCLDLTDELKKDSRFQMIPLTLQVGTATVVDDETFDQKKFIDMVKACPECPKTACPSPETFKEAYEAADAEGVFVITLSGHLSGSYNSAALAKKLYEEEQAEKGEQAQKKQVAVIDSLSASSGELNIGLFIQSLCEARSLRKPLGSGTGCIPILSWRAWIHCARTEGFQDCRHFSQPHLISSRSWALIQASSSSWTRPGESIRRFSACVISR